MQAIQEWLRSLLGLSCNSLLCGLFKLVVHHAATTFKVVPETFAFRLAEEMSAKDCSVRGQ